QVPPEGKAILVNIPGYEVIAFEDGEPVMRSTVIVGTRRDQTPVMQTETSVVRFRPTWRPTPEMIRRGEYTDHVRPAGSRNPLGLAALRLAPGMLVYLHDTNQRHLFDSERLSRSHGCVRVEHWDEIMAWALDIDLETFHAYANGRRTFDMPTDGNIPVTLGYFLNFPDEFGILRSHEDIYGRGGDSIFAPPPPAPVLAAPGAEAT
ncbi:MAG: L,D-transpeptidase family protein, partial [Pseudomonadota bacterium]